MVRFSVGLVSGHPHVFILVLSLAIVPYPNCAPFVACVAVAVLSSIRSRHLPPRAAVQQFRQVFIQVCDV